MCRNKQLATVDVSEAKRKWSEGLPVRLKEMAVALEISYEAVISLKGLPGFPIQGGIVFPEDYRLWRQQRFGILSSHTDERPQHLNVGKHDESSLMHDSPSALPLRAVRLLAQVA